MSSQTNNEANDSRQSTSGKANELLNKVVKALDNNGNGKIDIEDVIILGMKVPGVRIDRDEFFRKEFIRYYPVEVIEKAIATSPSKAGMSIETINHIADQVIKFERNCVSGLSALLSAPGSFAMLATIPADIAQYYGYTLRAAQKLLYLYGFPEINTEYHEKRLDAETVNILILCLGVMHGVAGANKALYKMAQALAKGVERKIIRAALTKGVMYPIIKKIADWFGIKITKEVLAGVVKKSIPVVGSVVGGGITFFAFKPCCDKLKKSLQNTVLVAPNSPEPADEPIVVDSYEEVLSDDGNEV